MNLSLCRWIFLNLIKKFAENHMTEFDLLSPTKKAWIIECSSCYPEFQHYAAAECVDGLPSELFELEEMADDDKNFYTNFEH